MVKRVTQLDLQRVVQKGARIDRIPALVEIPEMVKLFEHFHKMKHEHAQRHEANFEKKLAAMAAIVKAIEKAAAQSAKSPAPAKPIDLAPIMKLIGDIRKEHQAFALKMAERPEAEEHEPCDYKLTGKRDQRGLIDLEAGLTFTAVTR